METLTVHGIDIPRLGFGTWELSGSAAYDSVRTALEVGYRHVDTAQLYRNEEQVGRAIADSGIDRDELFVTTKVWRDKTSPDEIWESHEGSLSRLGLEHVDLLLIHWPAPALAVEEVVEALDRLRERGLTRLIGVSNHTAEQLERALTAGPVATNQVEYHPYLEQDAVLDVVRAHDLTLTAYSPLAKGKVVGDEVLGAIGADHDGTAAQVAIRWLLQQPAVLTIPRSQDPDHIRANFEASGLALTDEEMDRIGALARGDRQVDPSWGPWH